MKKIIITAALTAIAMNLALAEDKAKNAEVVIDGVAGFQNTPLQPDGKWHVHDPARPQPPVVTPGKSFSENAAPPADAIVLFDGKDLSQWRDKKTGGDAEWTIADGVMTSAKGDIITTNKFGDIQLHLEFKEPTPANGEGQGRGNSWIATTTRLMPTARPAEFTASIPRWRTPAARRVSGRLTISFSPRPVLARTAKSCRRLMSPSS